MAQNTIVVRARGARGPAGSSGTPGTQGLTGAQGLTGIGIQGTQGLQGTAGNSFSVSQVSFTYEKQANSTLWAINHNLSFRPNVVVIDYGQNNVECDIAHIDENNLTLTFSEPISGYAYLS